MSLLISASPWTNDDTNSNSKKRVSTMKKTIRPPSATVSSDVSEQNKNYDFFNNNSYENYQNLEPSTVEQSQTINENRNNKINDLLNKMKTVEADNDGSGLVNFNPPPKPMIMNKKTDVYAKNAVNELSPDELLPKNQMQITPNADFKQNMLIKGGNYIASDSGKGIYSNYNQTYDLATITNKPYYAAMGISKNADVDNKLLEKINYMIHLLEEQQNEKTNNVAEEFMLYTFLGVFMIFVVDSFARSGKYVR